jgi:hypothetical protein
MLPPPFLTLFLDSPQNVSSTILAAHAARTLTALSSDMSMICDIRCADQRIRLLSMALFLDLLLLALLYVFPPSISARVIHIGAEAL